MAVKDFAKGAPGTGRRISSAGGKTAETAGELPQRAGGQK